MVSRQSVRDLGSIASGNDTDAQARGLEPRHVPSERPGKPGGKRDTNRRLRTRSLSDAAIDLFLEKGIQDVTIDEIVQKASIAKGSFYRYFTDKKDLVDAIFAPVSEALHETFDRCQEELKKARNNKELVAAYERLATNFASAVLENAEPSRLYLQECRAPAVGAREPVCRLAADITRYALELTEAAKAHGLLKPVNPTVSALAVVGAVERLLFGFLSGEPLGEPDAAASTLIALVLDGLAIVPPSAGER